MKGDTTMANLRGKHPQAYFELRVSIIEEETA